MKLKNVTAVSALAIYSTAYGSNCSFTLSIDGKGSLEQKENCDFVWNKYNYGGLDNFYTYNNDSLLTTLSDETLFRRGDKSSYFVSENIDTPKVIIKTLSQSPATPLKFNGMTGYMGRTEYFIQTLPSSNSEPQKFYSGNISCLNFAAGNEVRSFSTRVCAEKNKQGFAQLHKYEQILKGIRP